ncbi:MAG: hypothetical protein COT74_09015 [Bdellovibrionales bacterium CG10_big_fil_rev_8_21_14_0_10_45_34]|nr:MAG: hypothetical protein COT74_09015 [Bdellovibrionales bacterium CG10_big_fil_rev_8_21_14_0_10_45_34]
MREIKKWAVRGIVASTAFLATEATLAGDISWQGIYRFEGLLLDNPLLDKNSYKQKTYFQHHLVLEPKIVVSDGVSVFSRFDIFNSPNYPNSQMGQFFGQGVGNSTVYPDTNPNCSTPTNGAYQCNAVNAQTMNSESLVVNHLYMTWTNEYGQFIAGRAPIQFGLGLTHNAGRGVFDHWLDTLDLVGFRVVAGQMTFFPMYGKVREGSLDRQDDVNDVNIQVQYDNPDSNLAVGGFFHSRTATQGDHDAGTKGTDGPYGNNTFNRTGEYNIKDFNFYIDRKLGDLNVAVEFAFQQGSTGLTNTAGSDVGIDAFGAVAKLGYKAESSNWKWTLDAGMLTGDNPDTVERYEGFLADRNFNVAMLMFNHQLGSFDLLGTQSWVGSSRSNSAKNPADTADIDTLTNTVFFAPGFELNFSDKWLGKFKFIYATLNQVQLVGVDAQKNLGFEVDMGLDYKPDERTTWSTNLGLLFPGDAYAGGINNYKKEFTYGLMTGVAVSF